MKTDAAPQPKFYVYAVVNPAASDPDATLLGVGLTRRQGRTIARELGLPGLRVRRAKMLLFES